MNNADYNVKSIVFLFTLVSLVLLGSQAFYIVEPGFKGINIRLGTVVKEATQPGIHYKVPVIDKVVLMDIRIRKATIETKSLSKDLQDVSTGIVLNYRIDDPKKLYQNIGIDFENVIINPFTQESVKAVLAQFTAEDLIQHRQEAKTNVFEDLKKRLLTSYIYLTDVNFTHLDFSPDFMKAVEEKQIAEQSAKRAKNLTAKVREEAVQTKARAEAQAYSLKAQREVVTVELIRLKEVDAQIKAIEKWNGILPQVTGGSIPMISLSKYGT